MIEVYRVILFVMINSNWIIFGLVIFVIICFNYLVFFCYRCNCDVEN